MYKRLYSDNGRDPGELNGMIIGQESRMQKIQRTSMLR